MDIHQLKIFAFVYKNRSFSRASEKLHITQPTISAHIKNLETELECSLFDRLGHTIIPTKNAEVLYPKALQLIEHFEKLKEELLAAEGKIKGQIQIGASTIPGTYILPNLVVEFKKKHPDVSFEVIIADSRKIAEMVLNHELLFGIVGATMEPKKLRHQPLIADDLVLAASERVIHKNTLSIEELAQVPFLIREAGSGTKKVMEQFLRQQDIHIDQLKIVAAFGSTAAIKQALKVHLGASILSRIAIQEELESGALKEIRVDGLDMKRDFYLVSHKKRTLPQQYSKFYDYIQEATQTLLKNNS